MSFLQSIEQTIVESYFEIHFAEMKLKDSIELTLQTNLDGSISEGISKKNNYVVKIRGVLAKDNDNLQLRAGENISFIGHTPSMRKALTKLITFNAKHADERKKLMYDSYGLTLSIQKESAYIIKITVK